MNNKVLTKNDLLALHDEAFIDQAYLYALAREADKEGKAFFLSQLRKGLLSKYDILNALQQSEEGKKVHVAPIKEILFNKLLKVPLVGSTILIFSEVLRLPTRMKQIEQSHLHLTNAIVHNKNKIKDISYFLTEKAEKSELILLREQINALIFNQNNILGNKNILICCNAYPPNFIGGAELIAHYQALELQKKGYTVKVFTGDLQSDTEHYGIRKESFDGIEVYRVKLTLADFDAGTVNFRHTIVEQHFEHLIETFNPSIMHMHNIMGLSVALGSIAKKYAIKTVMTLHDGWGFCYRNTMMRENGTFCHDFKECHACMPSFLDEEMGEVPISMRQDYFTLAFQDIDLFISPSDYLKEQYLKAGFNEANIKVLTNGIDIDKFNLPQIKSDKIRFTFIGHLGEHKGVKLILEALALLQSKDNIHLNIVGEGGLKDALQSYIDTHHLTPYVKLLGKVPNHDIPSLFSKTDVYILPSQWPENQPVTITEAFASKVPVIGTDFGGIKELVTHKERGLLFPMGDTESLAKQMQYFIDHPEKIKEFGNNAFAFIQHKTFDKQVKKLIPYYQEPLSLTAKERPFIVACVGARISDVSLQQIAQIRKNHKEISIVLHEWLINPYVCDVIYITDEISIEEMLQRYAYLQKPYLVNTQTTHESNLEYQKNIFTQFDDLYKTYI